MRTVAHTDIMCPYGYNRIDGKLVVNEKEASVVRNIFNLYSRGTVTSEIVDCLNIREDPMRNGKWRKHHVDNIVHNAIYAGFVNIKNVLTPGNHEPIVNTDVFSKINGPLC